MQSKTENIAIEQPKKKKQAKNKNASSSIGILHDKNNDEFRVCLIPYHVSVLVAKGHKIFVEKGAGEKSGFEDSEYKYAGAEITPDRKKVLSQNIIIQTSSLNVDDIEILNPNQIIISFLHLINLSHDYLQKLNSKKVIASSLENMRNKQKKSYIVRSMNEISASAIINILMNFHSSVNTGNGEMFGSTISTLPYKIVILGAGYLTEKFISFTSSFGVEIKVFDNRIYLLESLQKNIGSKIFCSTINLEIIRREIKSANCLIGTLSNTIGRSHVVITKETLSLMPEESIIIDTTIDRGGCLDIHHPMSIHDFPAKVGNQYYFGIKNFASFFAKTASQSISNNLFETLNNVTNLEVNTHEILLNDKFRMGVYSYKGHCTSDVVASNLNIKYIDLQFFINEIF